MVGSRTFAHERVAPRRVQSVSGGEVSAARRKSCAGRKSVRRDDIACGELSNKIAISRVTYAVENPFELFDKERTRPAGGPPSSASK